MLSAPVGPAWTHEDLDALPEGGLLRYELVDGQLLASSAPGREHQRVLRGLFLLLQTHCPPDLEVLFAPVDFRHARAERSPRDGRTRSAHAAEYAS